jgi:hypothetical protein
LREVRSPKKVADPMSIMNLQQAISRKTTKIKRKKPKRSLLSLGRRQHLSSSLRTRGVDFLG